MRRLFSALILAPGLLTDLYGGLVETVSPQLGKLAAPVSWTDETGNAHRLSESAGYPIILLPVYTRSRAACVTMSAS